MERKIYVNNDLDIVMARMQAREMAKQMGFGTADQARISLAASELARLLTWTVKQQPGEIVMVQASKNGHQGMQVSCLVSFQPGPEDLAATDQDDQSRQQHSLAGARYLVDESLIEPHNGTQTRVTLTKWLPLPANN